jgi:hypothetical protein
VSPITRAAQNPIALDLSSLQASMSRSYFSIPIAN